MPGRLSGGNLLKVEAVTNRLVSELKTVGFERVRGYPGKSGTITLIKKLNAETEIYLHPGVSRRGPGILIDPIIGVYNLKLRDRLVNSDGPFKNAPVVCHAYLGMLDSWSRFYVRTEDELEDAVSRIIRSVVEVGLPIMCEYDSFDKVRKLFQDDLARTKRFPVAVLFAKEKLEQMVEH